MTIEEIPNPEAPEAPSQTVDWPALRAQAEKLGISLSELQQRDREKKLRQARKAQVRPPVAPPQEPDATPQEPDKV